MKEEELIVKRINSVYSYIDCEPSIAYELNEYFSFFVPGYKFMPNFRNRIWDGKIYLFNPLKKQLYNGLIKYLEKFCKDRNYRLNLNSAVCSSFTLDDGHSFVGKIKADHLEIRDFQVETFTKAIRDKNGLFVCPTASGKSFIIYCIVRYLLKKTLIVVPTTTLVHQMYEDFQSYGLDSDKYCHKIFSGKEKTTTKPIVITTWQSIYKKDPEFFKEYEVVIGDEAHHFKSKSLTYIMSNLVNAEHRFGFTGTLDGTETHQLVLEGLFGPSTEVITTADLMERGIVADLKIKSVILTHKDDDKKLVKKMNYAQEASFLAKHTSRNNFIRDLALSLKGNTLILFQYVELQGNGLYNSIKDKANIPVYFIDGKVDGEKRNEIRNKINSLQNSILVASYGTLSTGVNIPNIDNVIFASPYKSRIKVLQSIGRGLRKSSSKSKCVLYDIVDDMTWKQRENFGIIHYIERHKIYHEQKFNVKTYRYSL